MLRVSAGAGTSLTRGVAALCSMDREQAVVSPVEDGNKRSRKEISGARHFLDAALRCNG